MKKSHLLITILVFICFFICGCNNTKTNDIEVLDNFKKVKDVAPKGTYDAYVGERYLAFYYNTCDYCTFSSSNEAIVTVDEAGYITAKKTGNAKIYAFLKDTCYAYILVNVIEKPTLNYNNNEELINEFKNKFDNYQIDNSFGLDIKYVVSTYVQHFDLKISIDPFYYEEKITTLEGGIHEIVKFENDGYYKYEVDLNHSYIEKTYLGDINYDISEFNVLNYNDIDEFKYFKYENSELSKENDNKYVFKFYVKDMFKFLLGFENDELLEYLSSVKDSIVVAEIEFLQDKICIAFNIDYHIVEEGILYELPININFIYYYNEFSEFNYENYDIAGPSTIDELTEPSELKDFYLKENRKRCAYTYLEKGYYVFNPSDTSIDNININVYDKDKNEINPFVFDNGSYLDEMIKIDEDGYYYFSFELKDVGITKIFFEKIDHEVSKSKTLESSSGKIEGKYDFDKFEYSPEFDNEAIKITNNGDKRIFLLLHNCYYGKYLESDITNYVELVTNYSLWIHPKKNMALYVIPDIHNEKKEYEYSFEVEIIKNDKELEETNDLITEKYGDAYFLGYDYRSKKFILNASKRGLYQIYYKNKDDDFEFQLSVILDGEEKKNLVLEEGTYLIEITNPLSILYGQIKYVFTEYHEKNVDIEIKNMSSYDASQGPLIKNERKNEVEIVKYHFILEEDSTVCLVPEYTQIFDEYGKPITFKAVDCHNEAYFKIKKGSYYATCDLVNQAFFLGKMSGWNYSGIDTNKESITEIGKKYYLNTGFNLYSFEFEEDTKISLSSYAIFIYLLDENFETIERVHDDRYLGIELEKNKKYYILVYPSDGEYIIFNKVE